MPSLSGLTQVPTLPGTYVPGYHMPPLWRYTLPIPFTSSLELGSRPSH